MVSPIIDGGDAGIDTGFKAPDSIGTIGGKEVVVTTPDRVAIQPYVEPDRTIMVRKLKPRVEARVKRAEHTSKEMSSCDVDGEPDVKINVKTKVIVPGLLGGESTDITSGLQQEFDFLSRTRGLEIGTERCNRLQETVDKLVLASGNKKWIGNTQVVILTKGLTPEAMAYPDGTIFISQSLINLFNNYDELAAVLGHEIHHLTNETFLNSSKANNAKGEGFGVKWFHEMTSDFGSAEVLNNAGFRTTAMKDALLKLKDFFGNSRGYEHQAPIIRAIEQFMLHMTKDFENSNKAATPLPKEFLAKPKETNLEIAKKIIVGDNPEDVIPALKKLHKRDLSDLVKLITNRYAYKINFYNSSLTPEEVNFKHERVKWELQKYLTEKASALGLNDSEIKLYLYTHDLVTFSGFDEINSLVSTADSMDLNNTIEKTNQALLESSDNTNLKMELVSWVRSKTYIHMTLTDSMYSNDRGLVEFVGKIRACIESKLPGIGNKGIFVSDKGDRYQFESYDQKVPIEVRLQRKLNTLVFEYISQILVKEDEGEVSQQKVTSLFKSLKAVGFNFSETYSDEASTTGEYNNPTMGANNNGDSRKYIEKAHQEVFGSEIVKYEVKNAKISFPTFEEFKTKIKDLDRDKLEKYLERIYYDNGLQEETPQLLEKRKLYLKFAKHIIDIEFEENESTYIDSIIRELEKNKSSNDYTFSIVGNRTIEFIEKYIKDNNIDRENVIQAAKIQNRSYRFLNFSERLITMGRQEENMVYELLEYYMNNPKNPNNLSSVQTPVLFETCSNIFRFLDSDHDVLVGKGIRDFQRFYELPYIQVLVDRFKKPLHFNNLRELLDYTDKSDNSEVIRLIGTRTENPLFRDSMDSSILLGPIREELARLTEPGTIQTEDFPVLIEIIEKLLPHSNESKVLIRQMNLYVLKDPKRTIDEKIDFFMSKYEELGVEGALIIGDQITEVSTYLKFKALADNLFAKYLKGEKGLTGVASLEFESTELVKNAELLIKTASRSTVDSVESSTKIAESWLGTVANKGKGLKPRWTRYNPKTRKVMITSESKGIFKSFKEIVESLKSLSLSERLSISLKALADTGGLLTTPEGKQILIQTLKSALSIKQGFIGSILEKAITYGKPELLGAAGAKMLAPLLFTNTSSEAVNVKKIQKEQNKELENDKIYQQEYIDDLGYIINQTTRRILGYGLLYQNQPNSTPAKEAIISTKTFEKIMDNLTLQIKVLAQVENSENSESSSKLPVSTEALIQAGESSAIFIRAMQMAVQVMDFSPAVRERLATTQDKMQGQTKLSFWDNMVGRTIEGTANYDPKFAAFMRDKFISLDEYLGGGSLFTTYAATIKGEDGTPERVIIKMLSPNAESNIEDVFEFSSSTLQNVIETSKGEVRDQAKLALTLLTLSYQWCLEDINDPNYIKTDDRFRKTIEDFNSIQGKVAVEASERVFTSKKIKVEAMSKGRTLNSVLEDRKVDPNIKRSLVERLSLFFDHQFIFPHTDQNGNTTYIFHSDPHAGNYMNNITQGTDAPLGVIDRSMYLELSQDENEMFKLLKNGKGTQFVQTFIKRCLELNGIDKADSEREIRTLNNELALEKAKQIAVGKENTSKFLEIIMSRFIKYGERYTCTDKAISDNDRSKIILDYLRKMPNRNSIRAFEDLQQNQDFIDLRLTYEDFTKTLSEMTDQGLLSRKAIDVPIKYRLMIRNIVAMQNLRKRFLS